MENDFERFIEQEVERRLSTVAREIEAWLVEQDASPLVTELLTFEISPTRKLLVLVPREVAEDVQALPLAELRARYPHKEVALP